MFQGKNELIFNQASMIEALQEYLDKRLHSEAPKPKVYKVLSATNPSDGQAFRVYVTTEEEKQTVAIPEQPKLLHFMDSKSEQG